MIAGESQGLGPTCTGGFHICRSVFIAESDAASMPMLFVQMWFVFRKGDLK